MDGTRSRYTLTILLVLSVISVVLLTPLGLETRPLSHVQTIGYVALVGIFLSLILDLASIALAFRRLRPASGLAIAAAVLVFLGIIADQAGSFSSLTPPSSISGVEYFLLVVAVVTIAAGAAIYRAAASNVKG